MGNRRVRLAVPVEHDQRFRILHRQGAQENRVHEAVDRCIGADPKRQRQRRHGREQRTRGHDPQSVAEILQQHTALQFYAAGRKYSTIPAPPATSTNPRYSIGLIADFGGCIHIATSTLITGAPPNTSGITYAGSPPDLNARMMNSAPIAPSAPATVAHVAPPWLKPPSAPCDASVATGASTPIRKY